MKQRNGLDTLVGFIPGQDVDQHLAPQALAKLFDWKGVPALGGYTDTLSFKDTRDFSGPVSYRAPAIPEGSTIDDVHAGLCDGMWTEYARDMVRAGQGEGYYFPGYEGAGNQRNGSAGMAVPRNTLGGVTAKVGGYVFGCANWAFAVSRQINVMRKVDGWRPWIGINFDVMTAMTLGLDPDPFRLITENFNSIDTNIYPIDSLDDDWDAKNDRDRLNKYIRLRLDVQNDAAKKYNVPMGIGETGVALRNDQHATGDDVAFVHFLHDYITNLDHNVAYIWLNNVIQADKNTRFADYSQATKTYRLNSSLFPKSSVAIGKYLDPDGFINRVPLKMSYTQEQLDAAVQSQKFADDIFVQREKDRAEAAELRITQSQVALRDANTHLATLQNMMTVVTAERDAANQRAESNEDVVFKMKTMWKDLNAFLSS